MVILTFYYITSNITNFSSDLKTGRRTGSVMQWAVLEERVIWIELTSKLICHLH